MATVNLNLHFNGLIPTHSFTNAFIPNASTSKFRKTAAWSPMTCAVSSSPKTQEPKEKSDQKRSSVAERWREIQGRDNWDGLLEPMDPVLRSELVRYGDMVQACYGSFNNDPYSKYCGSCNFPPKEFFQGLGMPDSGYEIASYIYSSNTSQLVPKFFSKSLMSNGPWNPMVNWIGYVAVSNDETTARLGRRDIYIAWRGTVTKLEWVQDLISFLKPVSAQNLASPDPAIKVMAGFLHIYTDKDQSCPYSKFSAREQVMAELRRLMKLYGNKGEEISITVSGHSLGSALAILNAYDIAESRLNVLDDTPEIPISVISFSGPRLGNTRFKKRLEELKIKVLRIFNVNDKVPDVPGVVLNENTYPFIEPIADWTTWFYSHVGVDLPLDNAKSPFVKDTLDIPSYHNLELLLHLMTGYHGRTAKFELSSDRDIALVNKEGDILMDEYLIPPNWLQVENKGLKKNEDGKWRLPEEKGIEDRMRPEDVEHHLRKLGLVNM